MCDVHTQSECIIHTIYHIFLIATHCFRFLDLKKGNYDGGRERPAGRKLLEIF